MKRSVVSKGRKSGRVAAVLRVRDGAFFAATHDWPDPPMVSSVALRRCEQAETIEEVRAIVHSFLRPQVST